MFHWLNLWHTQTKSYISR